MSQCNAAIGSHHILAGALFDQPAPKERQRLALGVSRRQPKVPGQKEPAAPEGRQQIVMHNDEPMTTSPFAANDLNNHSVGLALWSTCSKYSTSNSF